MKTQSNTRPKVRRSPCLESIKPGYLANLKSLCLQLSAFADGGKVSHPERTIEILLGGRSSGGLTIELVREHYGVEVKSYRWELHSIGADGFTHTVECPLEARPENVDVVTESENELDLAFRWDAPSEVSEIVVKATRCGKTTTLSMSGSGVHYERLSKRIEQIGKHSQLDGEIIWSYEVQQVTA